MSHTTYSIRELYGRSWCIEQQPLGVTDPMVVSFRRWKRGRSLLNRNARWTSAGWDPSYWVPRSPPIPIEILMLVERHMRDQQGGRA